MNKIIFADNLIYLRTIPDGYVDLIYSDPPFNTHKSQKRNKIKAEISENGLVGFGGNVYSRNIDGQYGSYDDNFDDYIGFLKPRLQEAYRILKPNGTMYLHLNWREVHYIKIEMDKIFGRNCFKSECIWHWDYGSKPRNNWAAKHDTILMYVKNEKHYTFNYDKVPRIKYLAPDLAGKEKAAKGKAITNVWWHTIVGTNSKEKQCYSTQKPLGILRRIVEVSSNPNDICLDFFAGSGSLGEACGELNRQFIMVDNNPQAFAIMKKRLAKYNIQTS